MITIQNTADQTYPWLRCLFYGETGSGKTRLASTFPAPLFLVPRGENSYVTLRDLSLPFISMGENADTGEAIPVRKHMAEVLTFLKERHDQMNALLKEGEEEAANAKFPWQTIVVESLTHYSELVQSDISRNNMVRMDQQKWGDVANHFSDIHNTLSGMAVHVVYTSLVKEAPSEGGKRPSAEPNMVGKASKIIPSACDILAYCEEITTAKGSTYRVHFRKHEHYPARSRVAGVPRHIDNFHFRELDKALRTHAAAQTA